MWGWGSRCRRMRRAPLAWQRTRRSVEKSVMAKFPRSDFMCGRGDRSGLMRMEWLRASDSFPACWACFLIYEDRVEVLAITGSKQRIDQSMSPDEARALWAKVRLSGIRCRIENCVQPFTAVN